MSGPASNGAGTPGARADSHGEPWWGRRIEAAPYADDDGRATPDVLAALTRLAAADFSQRSAAEEHLVKALRGARILVPIRAAAAEDGTATTGVMATALLRGPDGSLAQPVFTSVAALAAWDRRARPVPTPLPEAVRAALEEGCTAMPVDLADPHAAVLRASQLWALALGDRWVPAHMDPVVRLAVAEAAQGLDGLLAARVEDGSLHAPGTLRLVLSLRPGLSGLVVEGSVRTMGERLAAEPDVRRRIDDLAVVLHQVTDPVDAEPPPS